MQSFRLVFHRAATLLSTLLIATCLLLLLQQAEAGNDNPQDQTTEKKDSARDGGKSSTVQEKVPNARIVEPKTEEEKLEAARKAAEDRARRASARAKGEINFDDLKFDIEKDGDFKRSMLTKEIEELNKKTVRIRGYILPQSVYKPSGFEEFVLVRDNQECCFGPGAAIYDCIMVFMEKGKKADFVTRPVAVKGRFEIKEYKYPDSDKHYAIYQLIATEVK
jgi:hypothetical protein